MIKKSTISFIFSLLCLFHSQGFSEEKHLVTVIKTEITNAKWETPSNGSTPKLLSYDLEFFVDSTHSFQTTVTPQLFGGGQILHPHEFIQMGNEIEIQKEGYVLGKNDFSWFSLKHVPLQICFEATGNSIKPKMTIPQGAFGIEQVSYQNGQITFSITNTFVTLPVQSEKYHGYYEGKPLFVLGLTATSENEFGEYHYRFLLKDPETQETFEAVSLPLNRKELVVISQVKPVEPEFITGSMSWSLWKFRWEIYFAGSDKRYVSTDRYEGKGGSWNLHPEKQTKNFYENMGTEFKILEESTVLHSAQNSQLKIQSQKNGQVFTIQGPSRKAKS